MDPLLLGLLSSLVTGAQADAPIAFDADVLPILSEHCFHCHGPDKGTRKADLRLDDHDDVLYVAEPGEPADSELLSRVVHENPKWLMPPPEFGKPLSGEQIATLRRWVVEGVVWEEHWAYTPPRGAADEAEAATEAAIDRHVRAVLASKESTLAGPAKASTWLRRVTLDLTGLPPTLDEMDAFAAAHQSGSIEAARAAAVDRLLDCRARAEHRTRQWLDVARYADTNGYQNDFSRYQWPWRDWVLRAFEGHMPYDQFLVQQIAGDLLPDADTQSILATGFQRNHRTVTEAGSLDEEWRVENVADRAETTATAFLGLTLACARCHDHKYDALTQEDYYRFYGFFNSIDEKGVYQETRGNVPPIVSLPSKEQLARLDAIDAERSVAEDAVNRLGKSAADRHGSWRAAMLLANAPQSASVPEPVYEGDGGELHGKRDLAPTLNVAAEFERSDPFSVSLWVKPQSKGAIYSRMVDDDSYRGTDLVLLDGMLPAVHLIHSWPTNAIKVKGKVALKSGRWQHIAVSYDGSSAASGIRLFVDGRPAAVEIKTDALTETAVAEAPFQLGWRRYAGELTGEILDVRVHAAALDEAQVAALALPRALEEDGAAFFASAFDDELQAMRLTVHGLEVERRSIESTGIPTAMVLAEREEPRETRLLDRGRYDRPVGDVLLPDVPAVFGGLGEGARRDRLGLAEWFVRPDHPLTARVAVNRIWASFFGSGLVETLDDFGVRGERPVYRDLLDELSADFVASGWDVRAMERRIALSKTYGQSSYAAAGAIDSDPKNQLLARGPRHRLDAEVIRDQALAAAQLLVPMFGGPPVKPYQPDGLWKELAGGAGQGAYVPSTGDDLFRRSLYTYRKRTVPHPTLTTFDAPGFELCQVLRARTNTPLQALATLNDVTYVEAARHLASRMIASGDDETARLELGVRLVLSREPSEAELGLLRAAVARHRSDFAADESAASELLGVGATAPAAGSRTPEWAAYTMVASTLLNLDEALSKR